MVLMAQNDGRVYFERVNIADINAKTVKERQNEPHQDNPATKRPLQLPINSNQPRLHYDDQPEKPGGGNDYKSFFFNLYNR